MGFAHCFLWLHQAELLYSGVSCSFASCFTFSPRSAMDDPEDRRLGWSVHRTTPDSAFPGW